MFCCKKLMFSISIRIGVILMKNLFDKENSRKIKLLNKVSGLNHRSTPYDVNNVDDLKEMLRIKVCALLDYTEYEKILDDLLEKLDESIEYYDTSTWLSFTMDISEPDRLLTKCYDTTRKASDNFSRLTERTSDECLEALRIVLNSKEEIQKSILGFYICNTVNVEEKLIDIFDNVYDIRYAYNMDEAYNNFIEFIKMYLVNEDI